MAKNRSRRLRKKMHIEEFQEVGFSVAWRFPEGTSVEQITEEHQAIVRKWLEERKLDEVRTSELFDVWWD